MKEIIYSINIKRKWSSMYSNLNYNIIQPVDPNATSQFIFCDETEHTHFVLLGSGDWGGLDVRQYADLTRGEEVEI